MNRFAHMVGLPGHMDPLPGMQDHSESSGAIHYEERRNRMGLVTVSFKDDRDLQPLQRVLLEAVRGTQECFGWCTGRNKRKGITHKLKFYDEAIRDPGKAVMLDGSTQRMLAAQRSGQMDSQNMSYRPKQKFRTREPGVKSIIAFNLAFILWLMHGSM